MADSNIDLQTMWIENGRKQARDTFRMRMIAAISIIVFVSIWQLAVSAGLVNPKVLPAPAKIFNSFIAKFTNKVPDGNTLQTNIIASLKIALSGFFAAVIIGIPLGLIMGWFKAMDKFLTPIFEFVRPIPPIAWIPIVVLWMGIGLKAKALIIFFSAFVPCVINSYTGVRLTNPTLINVSKTFGASNFETFVEVGIPSALPMVMAGVRLALGNSWSTLVAAEMLAASSGLGFMIQMGRNLARPDIVILGMLVIGVLGAVMSAIFTLLENKLLDWKKR